MARRRKTDCRAEALRFDPPGVVERERTFRLPLGVVERLRDDLPVLLGEDGLVTAAD